MKRFLSITFICFITFCQLAAQDTENRYVKKDFDDIISYQHRLSHEKDKSHLLDNLPGRKLDAIAYHMSDYLKKQQFQKQFIANLQKEFSKEELLKLSSFTGVLTFKMDAYNELYDICFNFKESDIVLSDNDFDRIIACLETTVDDFEFDLEYLRQDLGIEISTDNRPFIRLSWGGRGWRNLR